MIFELDAKCVVDAFNSNRPSIAEFESLILVCKDLFSFMRVALLSASPRDYFDIP